jgi:predicted transcriptional regulator YheO
MSKSKSPQWLKTYAPICDAIARLLHPYAEVVVHDLASDLIVAIWNPFSGRKVGDPALISDLHDGTPELGVYGPYGKVLPDGRNLTSVSAVLADAEGTLRGLLCVNFDRSPLDGVAEMLSRFVAPVATRPPELFNRDWREQIALVIDEECRARHLRRDQLSRQDRLALVKVLNDKGLFSTRQAANHAAIALNVSRATIYSFLKEIRQ